MSADAGMLQELAQRVDSVEQRICAACDRAGRARSDVTLVAVSKTHPADRIRQISTLLTERGVPVVIGENYVQEWREKSAAVPGPLKVHFIGTLQSNKCREAVELFDLIETIHKPDLAKELNKRSQQAGKVQQGFLQVNISSDDDKSGFSVAALRAFLDSSASKLPHLKVSGLMTITRFYERAEAVRPDFVALRELRDLIVRDYQGHSLLTPALGLSMGMSADFPIAIEEGADFVRVGTALFGSRE